MKRFYFLYALLMAFCLIACDEHMDFPDLSMKVGDVVCTDGSVLPYEKASEARKIPIAVVFHLNHNEDVEGNGFAVYLRDLDYCTFCDSLGLKQNTSTSLTALDGNSNTYAMYASDASSAARMVFDLWHFGQSAYIPSVAQMNLLYQSKDAVNAVIEQCNGVKLSDTPKECWYWTSTEVAGQESVKAWLYSISSGAMQETPKGQSHKVRPIITLYN